jgi:hypothetical protein
MSDLKVLIRLAASLPDDPCDLVNRLKGVRRGSKQASPIRVAHRYKRAYGLDRGMGGLLFRMNRHGLYVQTMPSDPPYNQTYEATTMFGSKSGKLAMRKAMEIYETHKREIQRLKRIYDVHRFFEKELKESGVRGKLRWHTWYMPD